MEMERSGLLLGASGGRHDDGRAGGSVGKCWKAAVAVLEVLESGGGNKCIMLGDQTSS